MTDQLQKQYTNLIASINKVSYLLSKHDSIRLKHWLQKLATPMSNNIWRQNRNLYLKVLKQMINQGQLLKPFNQSPPQGPLPKMSIYDVPYPIRIKIVEQEHRSDKNTPINHKTSSHSRKNSLSNHFDPKRSISKGSKSKNMEHKKCIDFQKLNDTDKQKLFSQYDKQSKAPLSKKCSLAELENNTRLIRKNSFQDNASNTQKLYWSNNQSCLYSRKTQNQRLKKKGCEILKKGLKFLGKYFQQFENSVSYRQVLENIVETGDRIGENLREVTIPNTEQSVRIQKYNERIKDKIFQTDLNTMEFMNYLNSLV